MRFLIPVLLLAACAPTQAQYEQACIDQGHGTITEPFYQPGGLGYHRREAARASRIADCVQTARDRRHEEVSAWLAPVVAITAGAAANAAWQTRYPGSRYRPFVLYVP